LTTPFYLGTVDNMALGTQNAVVGGKPPVPGAVSGKPDPLIQPALANAMRLGSTFGRMSPSGSRLGIARPDPGGVQGQQQRQGGSPSYQLRSQNAGF